MTDNPTNDPLGQTPLHSLHSELGAKMVPFAGYEMPVQYPDGIKQEHLHTRAHAGLFDVSHMGQIGLRGAGAAQALEQLVPVDVIDLAPGRQRYALFTNDTGGVLDDLMITNAGDHLFLVVNAACKQQDIAHLQAGLPGDCELEVLTDRALLALQGPEAAAVLTRIAPTVSNMTFMTGMQVDLNGADCFVTRSGYTGEDGFEISVPAARAQTLARALLAHEEVAPIGLGARDSLRLEAGLCLYGHDLDTSTTPVEAGLSWAISKVRRQGGDRAGGFPGSDRILAEFGGNAIRYRVGIQPDGKAPVREGSVLLNVNDNPVGLITSGGYGPTTGAPVAMGYVDADYVVPDTHLQAIVRDKPRPVTVTKLPFVERRYYRG